MHRFNSQSKKYCRIITKTIMRFWTCTRLAYRQQPDEVVRTIDRKVLVRQQAAYSLVHKLISSARNLCATSASSLQQRKRSLAAPFGAFTSSSEPSWMRRTLAKAVSRASSPWQMPAPLVLPVHPGVPIVEHQDNIGVIDLFHACVPAIISRGWRCIFVDPHLEQPLAK